MDWLRHRSGGTLPELRDILHSFCCAHEVSLNLQSKEDVWKADWGPPGATILTYEVLELRTNPTVLLRVATGLRTDQRLASRTHATLEDLVRHMEDQRSISSCSASQSMTARLGHTRHYDHALGPPHAQDDLSLIHI